MVIPMSTIIIRLFDSCIRLLASQGVRQLFVDAVRGGDQGFPELGEWESVQQSYLEC